MLVTKGKTNWIYILILVAMSCLTEAAILWLTQNQDFAYLQTTEIKIYQKNANGNGNSSSTVLSTEEWKAYQDIKNGLEFKYPEIFGANVWRPMFWPPTTTIVSINEDPVKKGCPDFPGRIQGSNTNQVKINNIDYSLYAAKEGAMGSSYASYCYVTQKNQKYYVIYFRIRTINGCHKAGCNTQGCYESGCGLACGTQHEAECRNLDIVADIEKPIETIVSTFKFTEVKNETTTEPEAKDKHETFAKCLTAEGIKIYGASWCGHCQNQKKMFGSNWQYINYIECSQGMGQAPACQEAGIQGYPTWIFQNGQRASGELTFEQLSQYSGCEFK